MIKEEEKDVSQTTNKTEEQSSVAQKPASNHSGEQTKTHATQPENVKANSQAQEPLPETKPLEASKKEETGKAEEPKRAEEKAQKKEKEKPLSNEDKLRLYKRQSEERLLDIKRSREAKVGKKRR